MKMALRRTSAAVAVVLSFGLTALVDAEETAAPGQVPVEQATGAPQYVRATVASPEGRATMARQEVSVGDGATVTVVRPVVARAEESFDDGQNVQQEKPVAWHVAAGWRLWMIDPATRDVRTCAVRQTSTVGIQAIRCIAGRLPRSFGPMLAP